jgi:hypothetical protein
MGVGEGGKVTDVSAAERNTAMAAKAQKSVENLILKPLLNQAIKNVNAKAQQTRNSLGGKA